MMSWCRRTDVRRISFCGLDFFLGISQWDFRWSSFDHPAGFPLVTVETFLRLQPLADVFIASLARQFDLPLAFAQACLLFVGPIVKTARTAHTLDKIFGGAI